MITSEGKGIEMNNLAEIMPQVEQLKACNTSNVLSFEPSLTTIISISFKL